MLTAFIRTGPDCGRRLKQPILILRAVSQGRTVDRGMGAASGRRRGRVSGFFADGERPVSPSPMTSTGVGRRVETPFLFPAVPLARAAATSFRCGPVEALPPVPAGGLVSEQDVAQLPGARRIDALQPCLVRRLTCTRSIVARPSAISTASQCNNRSRDKDRRARSGGDGQSRIGARGIIRARAQRGGDVRGKPTVVFWAR